MPTPALGPVWVDAQLPPSLARRLTSELGVDAVHVFDFEAHTASDAAIFEAARAAGGVVITKDVDFVHLLERHGPPPRVIWITVGNVRNAELWMMLHRSWPRINALLEAGEPLIEINQAGAPWA